MGTVYTRIYLQGLTYKLLMAQLLSLTTHGHHPKKYDVLGQDCAPKSEDLKPVLMNIVLIILYCGILQPVLDCSHALIQFSVPFKMLTVLRNLLV